MSAVMATTHATASDTVRFASNGVDYELHLPATTMQPAVVSPDQVPADATPITPPSADGGAEWSHPTRCVVPPLSLPTDPTDSDPVACSSQARRMVGWQPPEAPDAGWDLVRATQAGNTAAFGQLYTRYQAQIRGFIHRRITDPDTVEDLVSTTFTRALDYIRRSDPDQWPDVNGCRRPAIAWLMNTALHVILSDKARAYRRHEVVFADHFTHDDDPGPDRQDGPGWVSEYGNPDHEVMTRIDRDAIALLLHAGLNALLPWQRHAVLTWITSQLSGQTSFELAAETGRSAAGLRTQATQARAELATLLAPNEVDRWRRGYACALERARTAHAARLRGWPADLPAAYLAPRDVATQWLREYLTAAGGSAVAADVYAASQQAGHGGRASKTLHAAKATLGVQTVRLDYRRWVWALPDPHPTEPASATRAQVA